MASPKIVELANLIAANTKEINEYLSSNNKPSPSFDVDALADLGMPAGSAIDRIRLATIQASTELQDLLKGPASLTRPETYNMTALELVYRFEIPVKFPIHEEISYSRLAELCDLNETMLRRILRHGMACHHVFCEPRKGFVAHTSASRWLAENPDSRDLLGVMFNWNTKMVNLTVDAMIQFNNSQEPNEAAFNLGFNTDKSVYEYLSAKPELGRRFAGAMREMHPGPANLSNFLVDEYPWGDFGESTVVDVGGSHGHITILLARRYPSLKFTIQDLPDVIAEAHNKGGIPADLTDRVTLLAHNFFTEQPVTADIYLFSHIFHNYSDKYCSKIIKSLIPALKPGAKVLISDSVLPEPNTLPLMAERNVRGMDLLMQTYQNARERELDEFISLFKEVDQRFEYSRSQLEAGTAKCTIEIVWNAFI